MRDQREDALTAAKALGRIAEQFLAPAPREGQPRRAERDRAIGVMRDGEKALIEMVEASRRDDAELRQLRARLNTTLAESAPPASDPPGLVALMVEWKRLRKAVNDADNGREGPPWSLIEECKAAYERVLAYPLPASPQAKED